MGPVIQEDGTAKNPLTFTDKEFSTNLFIDYSHSTSAVMGNFLETADYVTDQLVHEMGCVDSAVALGSATPIPYKDFLGQVVNQCHDDRAHRVAVRRSSHDFADCAVFGAPDGRTLQEVGNLRRRHAFG